MSLKHVFRRRMHLRAQARVRLQASTRCLVANLQLVRLLREALINRRSQTFTASCHSALARFGRVGADVLVGTA